MPFPILALILSVALPRAGDPVEDLALRSAAGERVSLHAGGPGVRATVLAFTGLDCPNAAVQLPRLVEIGASYAEKGVRFLAVDPNFSDEPAAVLARAERVGQRFPTLMDPLHLLTDGLSVRETTEVFVLDAQHVVRYRGAVDDQYAVGARKPEAERHYLRDALDAVLAGRSPEVEETDPQGCVLGPAAHEGRESPFTTSRDVLPILYQNCVVCHRPGQVGPMSFLRTATVRNTAGMIAEVTGEGRMPPWYADRRHGAFLGERGLSDTEIKILRRWAADGAPEGDPADAPPAPTFDDEAWQIGTPDLVASVEEPIELAATGVIPYAYRIIDPGLDEDVWISAIEIRPSNGRAAHHILAAAVPAHVTDEEALDRDRWNDFFAGGYFAIYVPGARPHVYPPGMAKKLKAGTRFLVEFHFTATGEPGTDRSRLALRFADGPVEHAVQTAGIFGHRFRIPPGEAAYEVRVEQHFERPIQLLTLFPHMHLRGRSFRFERVPLAVWMTGEGASEVLLDVPRYDPWWQEFYRLADPVAIHPGDRLVLTAVFDNSDGNPNNPDPTAEVTWGWQEWEEMMAGYVDYVELER